jgi:hypothetical protein
MTGGYGGALTPVRPASPEVTLKIVVAGVHRQILHADPSSSIHRAGCGGSVGPEMALTGGGRQQRIARPGALIGTDP